MIWIALVIAAVRGAVEDCASAVPNGDSKGREDSYFYDRLNCSGKGLNELGKYEACLRIPNSKYYLVDQKVFGIAVAIGVCVHSDCSEEDIENMMKQSVGSLVPEAYLEIKAIEPSETPLGTAGMIMVLLVVSLITLGVMGSWLDSSKDSDSLPSISSKKLKNEDTSIQYEPIIGNPPPPTYYRIIQSFSFSRNFSKLVTSRPKVPGDPRSTLDCLNSVRVLSIMMVITGHFFAYRSGFGVRNMDTLLTIGEKTWVAFTSYGALFSVDNFFWMSGFLFSMNMLGIFYSKNGKLSIKEWGMIYVHRMVRILPLYFFCLMLYMHVVGSLGSGPLWHQATLPVIDCYDYWWSNLLFINNFVPNGVGNGCYGIGWYLACDTQFFMFAPLLVFVYHRYSGKINWALHGILILICIMVSFTIAQEHNLKVVTTAPENFEGDYFNNYYFKPYTRYAPYIMGLLTGCVFFNYIKKSQDPSFESEDVISDQLIYYLKDTKYGAHVSFTTGFIIVLYDVLIQKDVYRSLPYAGDWTETENALFIAMNKSVFTLGLIMMLLPLLLGRLSLVYNLMSWHAWEPLAKLTYSAYHVHWPVTFWLLGVTESAVVYSGYQVFKDTVEGMAISFLIALGVHLLVEAPFMNLEQILFRKRAAKN